MKKLFSVGKAERNFKSVVVSLVDDEAGLYDTQDERDVNHYTVVTGITDESITICASQGLGIEGGKGDGLTYDGESVKIGSLYVMMSA